MELGIDVSQHQLTWDELLARTTFAEEADLDGAWIFDHFKPLYGDPKGPCLEAWSLLAALGAATSRIRLGTLVTGITYRHPSMLAAEVVTADHVSRGRVELAVGAAWFEGEHRQLGIDFPPIGERARRLEEAVQVIDLLLTNDDVDFEGRYYMLNGASYNPKPVQQPRPPLWIGAGGEKLMLPIVGRRADAWHGFGSASDLARKWRIVEEHASKAGRDAAGIKRSTSLSISEPWDEVRRTAEAYREAGISNLIVSWPSEGKGRLDEFLDQVAPELRSM